MAGEKLSTDFTGTTRTGKIGGPFVGIGLVLIALLIVIGFIGRAVTARQEARAAQAIVRQADQAALQAQREQARRDEAARVADVQARELAQIERFSSTWWYQVAEGGTLARATINFDPSSRRIEVETPFTFVQNGQTHSGITEIICRYENNTALDCSLQGRSAVGVSRRIEFRMYDRGGYLEGSYIDQSSRSGQFIAKTAILAPSEEVLREALTMAR